MIEQLSTQWPFAVVTLTRKTEPLTLTLPAVFLFDVPGGFILIKPGYLDPYPPASPQYHRIEATLTPMGEGFVFENEDYRGVVEPYEPTAEQIRATDATLEWYEQELERQGKRLENERADVRAQLFP